MNRRRLLALGTLVVAPMLSLAAAGSVSASNGDAASRPPVFGPALYADGEVWGTNPNGVLPAPNGNNQHAFDSLYVFPAGAASGQMPVAEAAPGPGYNGGRWHVVEVRWNATPQLVTSDEQLLALADAGAVSLTSTDTYFSCPLLRVK
jgi:hypothetical protein